MLAGRSFTDADRAGAPDVAVVSRNLARRCWPGENPLGKHLKLIGDRGWRTIAGVVGDVKWNDLADRSATALFIPLAQGPTGPMRLMVRAVVPGAVATSLRGVVASVDADAAVSDVTAVDDLVSGSLAQPRSTTGLLLVFALVALALGAVGIYGVTAYAVYRRARELGIRIALGAQRSDVLADVLWRGARLAGAGLALGLAGAFAATRVLSRLLYGVSPTDPPTFALVSALLPPSCWSPPMCPRARRCARIRWPRCAPSSDGIKHVWALHAWTCPCGRVRSPYTTCTRGRPHAYDSRAAQGGLGMKNPVLSGGHEASPALACSCGVAPPVAPLPHGTHAG